MMKHLILLLTLSLTTYAQVREEDPLPYFPNKPVKSISKNVTGWSQTLDGQWISDDQKIPLRVISRDTKTLKSKEGSIGVDNFNEFRLYPVLYNKDTLILLVKIYNIGDFKYEKTKKNWDVRQSAYYYLFKKEHLKVFRNITFREATVLNFDLINSGFISDVKSGSLISRISKELIIPKSYNRNLVLTIKTYSKKDEESKTVQLVQFQIHSSHDFTRDVEGVVEDYTILGSSLYGSEELLDYIYYECDKELFESLFSYNPVAVEFQMK